MKFVFTVAFALVVTSTCFSQTTSSSTQSTANLSVVINLPNGVSVADLGGISVDMPTILPVADALRAIYDGKIRRSKNGITFICSGNSTEVVSTAEGTVISETLKASILTIEIMHKYGYITTYSGPLVASVAAGSVVTQGQVIAVLPKPADLMYAVRQGTVFEDPLTLVSIPPESE